MPPQKTNTAVQTQIQERFAQLPKIVQDAITSADVEKQLRALADGHKLHIDQWGKLENEVTLALMGLSDVRDLEDNLVLEVGVPAEMAAELATDINKIVFEPIRQELERQLSHPEAKAKELTPEESTRNQVLSGESASSDTPPAGAQVPASSTSQASSPGSSQPVVGSSVVPATPPPPAPTEKAVRAPISSSYFARQASSERKNVEGDPYREPPQ